MRTMGCYHSRQFRLPCGLFSGELYPWHLAHASHDHPQPVIPRQDFDRTPHCNVLQAHAIHLCDFISNTQPSLFCGCEIQVAQLGILSLKLRNNLNKGQSIAHTS